MSISKIIMIKDPAQKAVLKKCFSEITRGEVYTVLSLSAKFNKEAEKAFKIEKSAKKHGLDNFSANAASKMNEYGKEEISKFLKERGLPNDLIIKDMYKKICKVLFVSVK